MEPGKDISIRLMNLEDINWVLETEKICFPDPWTGEHFESEIIQNNFSEPIIATLDNEKAGYAVPWFIAEKLEITNIAVLPKFRRMKIGSSMISHILGEAKKKTIKFCYLKVDNSNYGAIELYREFGFKEIGKRKNYYRENSSDALIMMKELN